MILAGYTNKHFWQSNDPMRDSSHGFEDYGTHIVNVAEQDFGLSTSKLISHSLR
jgi:hypothetical protein